MAKASPKPTKVAPASRSLRAPRMSTVRSSRIETRGDGGAAGTAHRRPGSVRRDTCLFDDRPPEFDLLAEPFGVRLRRRLVLGGGRAPQLGQLVDHVLVGER